MRDPLVDTLPPPAKEAKQKDKGKHKRKHRDQRHGSARPSSHGGSKKIKQQMLEFPSTHPLTNISIFTNGGFFTNEFVSSRLADLIHISDHSHHVLNKSEDATNLENFGQTTAITQHLQGSLRVNKLKAELKKEKDCILIAFSTNINLAKENLDFKA